MSGPRARARRPTLLVAAYPPELAALGPALARAGRSVTTAAVGIGAIDAAAGAARAIATVRPARVLLVGTCGLYRGAGEQPRWPLGAVVIARQIRLASLAAAQSRAYLPRAMVGKAQADAELRRALMQASGHPAADVACPLGITRTMALARTLSVESGAQVENLEAFAVARAAATASIPFAAALGIANLVGPRAHEEWRANGAAAAAAACQAVLSVLQQLV